MNSTDLYLNPWSVPAKDSFFAQFPLEIGDRLLQSLFDAYCWAPT